MQHKDQSEIQARYKCLTSNQLLQHTRFTPDAKRLAQTASCPGTPGSGDNTIQLYLLLADCWLICDWVFKIGYEANRSESGLWQLPGASSPQDMSPGGGPNLPQLIMSLSRVPLDFGM